MTTRATTHFLKTETGAGSILAVCAIVALLLANSPLSGLYFGFLETKGTLTVGGWTETHSVLEWIKEGLMAIFFFVVGLEIKQEVLKGELSNPRKLALPVLAAVGGMVAPALIYLALNQMPGGDHRGWSVPVATDIAFALAALAAVGKFLPPSLRVFLLTLAIVDDLGAVVIIAAVYSGQPDLASLGGAAIGLAAMTALGFWRKAPLLFWAVGFLVVWAFFLRSGVSTSLAGVFAAMTVPPRARKDGEEGLLKYMMEALHPWVAYAILPLFAFAAAGMDLRGSAASPFAPPALGVIVGLLLGKAIGVFGASVLAVKSGLAQRPDGASWVELFGVSILCGVGFTMSLFIASLAIPAADAVFAEVKMGVLIGSVLSIAVGCAVLAQSANWRAKRAAEAAKEASAA